MSEQTPSLRARQVVLCGALVAAVLGTVECIWLLAQSNRPGLDLAALPFAVLAYTLAGGLVAVITYPLSRAIGRPLGTALFPWRVRVESAAALRRAWMCTNLIGWLALIIATDVVYIGYSSKLSTPFGMAVVAGAGAVALLVGYFVVPRHAKRGPDTVSVNRGALAFFALLAAGLLAPTVLDAVIFKTGNEPANLGYYHSTNGPALLAEREAAGPPTEALPDVVVITLDTTRADHLSAYGYERDTTPRLEEFAREAVRFDCAWSASSWTLPSHATLFTGLFPHSHGARYRTAAEQEREIDPTRDDQPTWVRPLDPAMVTLAEVLKAYGYQNGAFVAGPYLAASFGTAQGFDVYDDQMYTSVAPELAIYHWVDRLVPLEPDLLRFGHGYRRADELNERIFDWLEQTEGRRFLFANYFDAHEPYWPVAEHASRYPGHDHPIRRGQLGGIFREVIGEGREVTAAEREWITSQYDAEIRFQDDHLGKLFDALKAQGRWDKTLVIVTADHGEHLGERNLLGHGFTVYAPVTRIPMLVKFPKSKGIAAGTRDYPVHLADVTPTVLQELGAATDLIEYPMQGLHLLDEAPHPALSELYRDKYRVERFGERFSRNQFAWIENGRRLVKSEPLDADGNPAGEPLYEGFADSCLESAPPTDGSTWLDLQAALQAYREAITEFAPSEHLKPLESSDTGSLDEVGYAGGDD